MTVFVNGRFVPEAEATVSVFDRSFLYGDGLFETVRVANGRPFRLRPHLERLSRGAEGLGIRLPFDTSELIRVASDLLRLNKTREALLRVTASRGIGPRGYSPRGADRPFMVISTHPVPPIRATPASWTLATVPYRMQSGDPLTRWKTANKLLQVLARREAEQKGAHEALLRDEAGQVCETTSGNVFWISRDGLGTPPSDAALLPGITREIVIELARLMGIPVIERPTRPEDLTGAEGVFLTQTSLGLVEVTALDGTAVKRHPLTARLQEAYFRLVASETA